MAFQILFSLKSELNNLHFYKKNCNFVIKITEGKGLMFI